MTVAENVLMSEEALRVVYFSIHVRQSYVVTYITLEEGLRELCLNDYQLKQFTVQVCRADPTKKWTCIFEQNCLEYVANTATTHYYVVNDGIYAPIGDLLVWFPDTHNVRLKFQQFHWNG